MATNNRNQNMMTISEACALGMARKAAETRYTYVINNGSRDLDMSGPVETFATEAEALDAGLAVLDDCCPSGSKMRSRYGVFVRKV